MTSTARRRLTAAGLLLATGLAVPVIAAAPASATSCTAMSATVSACSKVTSVQATGFKVAYRDSGYNGAGTKDDTLTCTASSTTSSSYSVSATVEANVKASIFAEFKASVTGGLEKSLSTQYGSTYTTSVPAGKTIYCTYGIFVPKVSGETSYDAYSAGKHTHIKTVKWTANAPQRNGWKKTDYPI